jgi:HK97 gp10 family phage protein
MNTSGNNFWVDVDTREVQAMFDRLAKAGATPKDIQPILRKAATPLRQEARSKAPVNKSTVNTLHATVRRHYSGGKVRLKVQIHAPGNLRKSIAIFKSKRNKFILYVGNLVGRSATNDGWYGRLVHAGFKAGGKTSVMPKPFMDQAFSAKSSEVLNIITKGLLDLINKYENK